MSEVTAITAPTVMVVREGHPLTVPLEPRPECKEMDEVNSIAAAILFYAGEVFSSPDDNNRFIPYKRDLHDQPDPRFAYFLEVLAYQPETAILRAMSVINMCIREISFPQFWENPIWVNDIIEVTATSLTGLNKNDFGIILKALEDYCREKNIHMCFTPKTKEDLTQLFWYLRRSIYNRYCYLPEGKRPTSEQLIIANLWKQPLVHLYSKGVNS